ncbi:unnamed protein product, partial [Amoebophrya sp. A25]|eukprot:GSA25T00006416001.1
MLWKDQLQQEALQRALAQSLGKDNYLEEEKLKERRRRKQITGLPPMARSRTAPGLGRSSLFAPGDLNSFCTNAGEQQADNNINQAVVQKKSTTHGAG